MLKPHDGPPIPALFLSGLRNSRTMYYVSQNAIDRLVESVGKPFPVEISIRTLHSQWTVLCTSELDIRR